MIIYIVFFSVKGHIYKLAEAVAEGARSVEGASVKIFRAADIVPDKVLEKRGAVSARDSFAHIPIIAASELGAADAVIFGTPTRTGTMASPMRSLLDQTGSDQTGSLWADGALNGKVGSVFTSTIGHEGGHESALDSFHVTLLHLGMIIVGVPYCENRLLSMQTVSGRAPYGISGIVGSDGILRLDETEIGIARFQGQHVAEITRLLSRGRGLSPSWK
jgi:NAD(P)H dehydrogenase (quinone)